MKRSLKGIIGDIRLLPLTILLDPNVSSPRQIKWPKIVKLVASWVIEISTSAAGNYEGRTSMLIQGYGAPLSTIRQPLRIFLSSFCHSSMDNSYSRLRFRFFFDMTNQLPEVMGFKTQYIFPKRIYPTIGLLERLLNRIIEHPRRDGRFSSFLPFLIRVSLFYQRLEENDDPVHNQFKCLPRAFHLKNQT